MADPKKAKQQEEFNDMMDEYFKERGKDTFGNLFKDLFKEEEAEGKGGFWANFLKN